MINISLINSAKKNLTGLIEKTPVIRSYSLSKLNKNNTYLKLESLQQTGSFKLRGSTNKLLNLSTTEKTDFLLLANKNYAFSKDLDKPYIFDKSGGTHGGNPSQKHLKTGFIACGRNIKQGTILENMRITQIAPAVSELLNLGLSCSTETPPGLIQSSD